MTQPPPWTGASAVSKILSDLLIRLSDGKKPAYDPSKELMWDQKCNSSSWFVIGHFEAEGHKLNYLFHQMVWPGPDGQVMNSVLSVTDETNGYHYGEDNFYPMDQVTIADDRFLIKDPTGSMEGDLDHMTVKAANGGVKLDLTLDFADDIILNGGSGQFDLAVIKVHQYSKPRVRPSGTLTIDGHAYKICGDAWFDRQWQQTPGPVSDGDLHWCWMDLNIDGSDRLSMWSISWPSKHISKSWATMQNPDGSQRVVKVEPFMENSKRFWKSPASGQNYPVHCVVNIPELNASLEVKPRPIEQEIASEHISKYEAASEISGTYRGEKCSGFCYIEYVGIFK